MKKIINILIALSINSLLFAGAGMEAYLVKKHEHPTSYDDIGMLMGYAFALFIGVIVIIEYIKDKFKS